MASSHDGYWERDLRTDVSWYSPGFRTMFGFAAGELPDDRAAVNARIHPDDLPAFLGAYDDAIRRLGRFTYELRFLDRAGIWRWTRGRGRVWADADGRAAVIAGALSDVHREKLTQQALTQMTQRFERAIAATDEALFERHVGRDEMFLAPRFAELLGYTAAELGQDREAILALMHPDDRAEFERRNADGVAQRARWTVSYRARCKSGQYRWFRSRMLAEDDGSGDVRVTGVMADIHDQVLAREALQQQHEQLEALVRERTARLEATLELAERQRAAADRANQAKSLFLAHMSHEIRTPLNGVLGLNELALRSAESPAQRRQLQLALQSGRSLLSIINDVLDYSKLEAGKLDVAEAPFDLAELLAQALREVTPTVRRKDLDVLFDHIGDITRVRGDAERVRQIAINLLGNAAKFTEQGHLALVTTVRPAGPGRCEATIEFRDTGPGMDEATQQRVFAPFEQGDASLSRRHGGTGLGLSIALGLTRALGGELQLDSTPGAGSCFTLRLPLALDIQPRPERLPPGDAWLLHARRPVGEWVAARLARMGWRSQLVPGIAGALQEVRDGRLPRPELVIVPESALDDEHALALLRAALPAARITLLVRPDWDQPALEQAAIELDMTLCFTPLTPRDLQQLLQPSTSEAPTSPITEPGALPHRVMLVEDNEVNRLIAEQMLSTLGLEVDSVDGGEAALAACRSQPPDLMLLDLQMPGLDGHATCRRLREQQQLGALPHFPIVALTAHALDSDRAASLASGMDGFLTKPIVLAQLRRELLRWLGDGEPA